MAAIVREVLAIPAELKSFVVSKPALELPVITARSIRDTTELHLANKGIERLCGFDRFVNLEVLYINSNKLPSLDGLEPCFRVKSLFADHNALVTLEGPLTSMKFLRELDVSHNKLADLDWQLETLSRMQYLETLHLDGNPCAQEMGYRARVVAAVPSLTTLDGQAVTAADRARAASASSSTSSSAATKPAVAVAASPIRTAASSSFGRGRPQLEGHSGLELTRSGRPMFGAEGDTLLQRTLRSEARRARRRQQTEQRQATLRSIAAAAKGHGWRAAARKAEAAGRTGGALRSLLSRRGAGLVDDAVVGSMLSRGCSLADTRRAGLGLLADASTAAARADAAHEAATGSSFERHANKAAAKARQLAASARCGSSLRGPRASDAVSLTGGVGGGLAGEAAEPAATKDGGGGGSGKVGWRSVRRHRESMRDASSLTDDMRSLAGSRASGSASATASLLSSVGSALRKGRQQRHLRAAVGGQAMQAASSGVAKGVLGEWELARLRKLFSAHDADSSGSLSPEEFYAALADAADHGFVVEDASEDGVSRAAAAAAFRELDKDGSGSISHREFVALLRAQGKQRTSAGDSALRFRSLSAEEATARAEAHFKTASGLHSRLLRLAADDPKHERLQAQAMALSEKGSRLLALAGRLRGHADPPERPPPPPKARRDFRTFILSVPEREARKTLQRGNRSYRIPPPGQESDSESDDDEGKQLGEDVDDYRRTVRARKPHVVFKSTVDI